jgi:hypothetical protein
MLRRDAPIVQGIPLRSRVEMTKSIAHALQRVM